MIAEPNYYYILYSWATDLKIEFTFIMGTQYCMTPKLVEHFMSQHHSAVILSYRIN